MSAGTRGERGTTLIELLVAMTLMLVVMGASMTAYSALEGQWGRTQQHNDAQDEARRAVDTLARDLRNLASPTDLSDVAQSKPNAIEVAKPDELVFMTVDAKKPAASANSANVRRVRYCLDAADPARGVLYMQWQSWTTASAPAAPAATSCPGVGWPAGSRRVIAQHVVNATQSPVKPTFSYNAARLDQITRVGADLAVDTDPGRGAAATDLSTAVLLRNQNQYPTAQFTWTRAGSGVLLNGSVSTDPEEQQLKYCWYLDAPTPTPAPIPPADCAAGAPAYIGEGITNSYPTCPAGAHRYTLVVRDPAYLRDETTKTFSC